MNFSKLTGFLHILIGIFISLYGVLFKKSWFDYVYMLYAIIVMLSYVFLNGECCISYYIKKSKDKNYIPGKEPTDLKDMNLLFKNKFVVYFIILFINLFNLISEYIVFRRNNFSSLFYVGFPFAHLLYILSLRYFKNIHKNKSFLFIQNIFKIIFIFYFLFYIYLFYRNSKFF